MTQKKIAVVIPKYGLVGGGEKFAAELTSRIAKNTDYDIHVFANKWQSNCQQVTFHKVPIISFPKFLTTISFACWVNLKISKYNFDLIHTHERIFDADLFTMHGIPHRIWVKEVRKKNMSLFDYGTSWVEKKIVHNERCRRFFSVSALAQEMFLNEYFVDNNTLGILHPGVDWEAFSSGKREIIRTETRKRYPINKDDIVISFVSMNFELKGLDKLLAAVAILKEKKLQKNIKILVAGRGNIKKFKKIATSLSIESDVFFTGVWQKNIQNVYFSSDIFVMLSGFDTFGMSVLEAMASKLPVIISNRVGAKDLVVEGKNGFVVNRDDITGVSKKIEILLDDEYRQQMGKHAHKTASQNTWDDMADKMIVAYEEILEMRANNE